MTDSSITDIWVGLGIPPTREIKEIKRAYARLLKERRPEDDPKGFQQLRAWYEQALAQAEGPLTDFPVFEATAHLTGVEQTIEAMDTTEPVETEQPDFGDAFSMDNPVLEERADGEDLAGSRVDVLLNRLISLSVNEGPEEGCAYFDQVIRPHLADLKIYLAFEEAVAISGKEMNSLPPAVLKWIASYYRWLEDYNNLRRFPFLSKLVMDQALKRAEWDNIFLQKDSTSPAWQALVALRGPCKPWQFRRLALQRPVVAYIHKLLNELCETDPEMLDRDFDPESVAWWLRHKSRRFHLYNYHLAILLPLVLGLLWGLGPIFLDKKRPRETTLGHRVLSNADTQRLPLIGNLLKATPPRDQEALIGTLKTVSLSLPVIDKQTGKNKPLGRITFFSDKPLAIETLPVKKKTLTIGTRAKDKPDLWLDLPDSPPWLIRLTVLKPGLTLRNLTGNKNIAVMILGHGKKILPGQKAELNDQDLFQVAGILVGFNRKNEEHVQPEKEQEKWKR